MEALTTSEFAAMADELREYAAAHPINILERVRAGEGPPWAHRRDFAWRGCRVRVLLTEDLVPFPTGTMRGQHLSVLGHDGPLPAEVTADILCAFFPGSDAPGRHDKPGGGELITMPSRLPYCMQYILLTPEETT